MALAGLQNFDTFYLAREERNDLDLTKCGAAPNGAKTAFVSTRDGNREIYAMNADGFQQTRLTRNSAVESVPAWSPDGAKIAFVSLRDDNPDIYVMSANG